MDPKARITIEKLPSMVIGQPDRIQLKLEDGGCPDAELMSVLLDAGPILLRALSDRQVKMAQQVPDGTPYGPAEMHQEPAIPDACFEQALWEAVHPSQKIEGGIQWGPGDPPIPWPEFLSQYLWYRQVGQVLKPRNFLEIGVGHGYSSFALLSGLKQMPQVWWIDNGSGWGKQTLYQYSVPLLRRLADWPDVYETREDFPKDGVLFDLIHVDADHSYDETLANIRFAAERCTEDGHIICHDANDEAVSTAIDDFGNGGGDWWPLPYWRVRCGVRVLHRCHPADCPLHNWGEEWIGSAP